MIYYAIATGALLVSIITMLVLVIRRLPEIAAINIDSIAEERVAVTKNRIALNRLSMQLGSLRRSIVRTTKPLSERLSVALHEFYDRLNELERETKEKAGGPLKQIDIRQEVRDKLAEAQGLLEKEEFEAAERLLIRVIELEQHNIEAYEGLAQIYLANRDYRKARETSRFLLKLMLKKVGKDPQNGERHQLARCYADLAEIYEVEGKNSLALKNVEKAVELEPSNPRFLDFMLKISIMLKHKELAWQTFNRLEAADPENKRLPELRKQVQELES